MIETKENVAGWIECTYGDLLEYIQPTKYIVDSTEYDDKYKIPVLTAGKSFIKGYTNEEYGIFENLPAIIFDDFTTASRFVNFYFKVKSSAMKILVPCCELVNLKFIYYSMQANLIRSDTHKRYWISVYAKKSLFLPPVNEQKRIVAKIEELFSELDKGIESLKTAREQLKVYRQAVLKHIFEGKLTSKWREENKDKIESADQLFTRIKQEREAHYQQQLKDRKAAVKTWEQNGKVGKKPANKKKLKEFPPPTTKELESLPILPKEWVYIRMGLSIDEPQYGTSKKCDYESEGVGVLRIPNIVQGAVNDSDLKFARFDDNETEVYSLRRGDILIIRSNGSISIVGKCALIGEAEEKYLYAGYLIRIRSNPIIIDPAYLLMVLSSHFLRAQIEYKAKSTSGVNNINSGELQSLIIPICSIREQMEIDSQHSRLLSTIDAMAEELNLQLKKSETLHQSILKMAFSGKLVEQDPSDEPASALLEQIKAEKEKIKVAEGRPLKKRKDKAKSKVETMIMKNLITVLELERSWISASAAFLKCGIGDGAETDEIEKLYEQLRDHISAGRITTERRGDEDWICLNRTEAA
jgi:type I restriction enzyme, S subunit